MYKLKKRRKTMFKVLPKAQSEECIELYGILFNVGVNIATKAWKYAAVDEDGEVYVYTQEPEPLNEYWSVENGDDAEVGQVGFTGDWKDSLIEVSL